MIDKLLLNTLRVKVSEILFDSFCVKNAKTADSTVQMCFFCHSISLHEWAIRYSVILCFHMPVYINMFWDIHYLYMYFYM